MKVSFKKFFWFLKKTCWYHFCFAAYLIHCFSFHFFKPFLLNIVGYTFFYSYSNNNVIASSSPVTIKRNVSFFVMAEWNLKNCKYRLVYFRNRSQICASDSHGSFRLHQKELIVEKLYISNYYYYYYHQAYSIAREITLNYTLYTRLNFCSTAWYCKYNNRFLHSFIFI